MNGIIEMFKAHMYGDLSESYLKYTAYAWYKQVADLALSNDLQEFSQLAGFYVYMVSSSPNQNFHQNISNCHRYCGEINIKNVAIYWWYFSEKFWLELKQPHDHVQSYALRHTKLLIDYTKISIH